MVKQYSSVHISELRAMGHHLPYGDHTVTCHLTQVNVP